MLPFFAHRKAKPGLSVFSFPLTRRPREPTIGNGLLAASPLQAGVNSGISLFLYLLTVKLCVVGPRQCYQLYRADLT